MLVFIGSNQKLEESWSLCVPFISGMIFFSILCQHPFFLPLNFSADGWLGSVAGVLSHFLLSFFFFSPFPVSVFTAGALDSDFMGTLFAGGVGLWGFELAVSAFLAVLVL